MSALVRRIGALLLAAAAMAVWFAMAPEDTSAPDNSDLVSQALSDGEDNAALTDSAPQQQVVNGWVARDLLAVLAIQQEAQARQHADSRDERPAALLLILVLAVGLGLATADTTKKTED